MFNQANQKSALTTLTRLCQTNPSNTIYLKQALRKDLRKFSLYAVEIAKETGDPIGKVLAECLVEYPDSDLYITLSENLTESSIALGEVHLLVAEEIYYMASDQPHQWGLIAHATIVYAEALFNSGEQHKALKYAQEGACLYQRNAVSGDLDHLQSFSFLSSVFMSLGQMDNAILLQNEVIQEYQSFSDKTKKEYITDYSQGLLQLCIYHNSITQLGKAISYGEQALQYSKHLNDYGIDEQYLQLSIKRMLADSYEKADQLTQAANLLRACISIARDLCNQAYDRFILELISTLEALATIEARLGNKSAAKNLCEEVIRYMQKIYQYRPQVYGYEYAGTLIVIGNVQMMFDDLGSALQCFNQAINLLDPLHQKSPDSFNSLATALSNRLGIYLEMTCYEEAIKDCYRLICFYRTRPQYKADLAFTLKRLTDCRIYNGEMFKAERSIHTSVQYFYDLTEKDEYFLSDLCYALSSMAVVQKNMGDCNHSLETTNEILKYMEHDDGHVKEANLRLYFSVLICRLQCFIDTEQHQQGLESADFLLETLATSRYKEGKLYAEALSMRSDVLISLDREHEALENALGASQHYRSLVDGDANLINHKIDLAHSLSRVCFLQSSCNPNTALSTIKEVLQLQSQIPPPYNNELLAEKAKAFAYQADIGLELGLETLAIGSIKEALLLQKELLLQMDQHTDYNLLRFHRINMKEAGSLLKGMQHLPSIKPLFEELERIEQEFSLLTSPCSQAMNS